MITDPRIDPFQQEDRDDPADELHRARPAYRGPKAAELADVSESERLAMKAAKEAENWEHRDDEAIRRLRAQTRWNLEHPTPIERKTE